jgi:hypothetical protein
MRLSKYLLVLAGGLVGATICLAFREFMSPLRGLDDGKVQIYILASCRGSRIAAQEFSVPPAKEVVQLIPFDSYDNEIARPLCQQYLREATLSNLLLRFIPEKFACNWLAQDARRLYGDSGHYPVMVFKGEVLTWSRTEEVFAHFGISMSTTRDTFGISLIPPG